MQKIKYKKMNSRSWYLDGRNRRQWAEAIFQTNKGKAKLWNCNHGFPLLLLEVWTICPFGNCTGLIHHALRPWIGLADQLKTESATIRSVASCILKGLAIKEGIKAAHILAHDLGDTELNKNYCASIEENIQVTWPVMRIMNGGIFPENSIKPAF